jgi:sulfur relay (sulfurtransferase) complex TusBCD TusD component (DsrE family)
MKRKLGLLLSLPPSHASAYTVQRLTEAALEAGHEVYLYLIDEGVKNIHSPQYQSLVQSGAKVFVCGYGCQQHHVSTTNLDPKVSLCGLVVLSGIIDACDPFLSFT